MCSDDTPINEDAIERDGTLNYGCAGTIDWRSKQVMLNWASNTVSNWTQWLRGVMGWGPQPVAVITGLGNVLGIMSVLPLWGLNWWITTLVKQVRNELTQHMSLCSGYQDYWEWCPNSRSTLSTIKLSSWHTLRHSSDAQSSFWWHEH